MWAKFLPKKTRGRWGLSSRRNLTWTKCLTVTLVIFLEESSNALLLLLLLLSMLRFTCSMNLLVTLTLSKGWKLPKLFALCSAPTGIKGHLTYFEVSGVQPVSCFLSTTLIRDLGVSACNMRLHCIPLSRGFPLSEDSLFVQLRHRGRARLECVGLPVRFHLLPLWQTWSLRCGDFAFLREGGYQHFFGWFCAYWESEIQRRVPYLQGMQI